MTTVVVNDASCLIDLHKGRLLHAMLGLPFRFLVPYAVRTDELLTFTAQEWQMLEGGGMEVYDLPPDAMAEAMAAKAARPRLSAKDAMCLVATRRHAGAILLTGDGTLRRQAEAEKLAVHGVLWLADQLHAANAASAELLCAALMIWREDPAVFLPAPDIALRLRRWTPRGSL